VLGRHLRLRQLTLQPRDVRDRRVRPRVRHRQLTLELHDLLRALDRAVVMGAQPLDLPPRLGELARERLPLGPLLDEPPLQREQRDVRRDRRLRVRGRCGRLGRRQLGRYGRAD